MKNRITSISENGPPPEAAGVLYPGEVMHHRLKPFGHRFVYGVFSLLDRPRPARRARPPEPAVFGQQAEPRLVPRGDHVERDGETIRAFADRLLDGAGLKRNATTNELATTNSAQIPTTPSTMPIRAWTSLPPNGPRASSVVSERVTLNPSQMRTMTPAAIAKIADDRQDWSAVSF